jgi:hypothetical protein
MKTAAVSMAVAMLGFASTSNAADSLPIQRGYYVATDTPCQQASNATLTLYNGTSFGDAHVECRKPSTKKLADGSYQLSEQCRDLQGNGGRWERMTTNYKVVSRTEIVATNSFGKFQYRYCRQSDMPDPWNTNDLKSIGAHDSGR